MDFGSETMLSNIKHIYQESFEARKCVADLKQCFAFWAG